MSSNSVKMTTIKISPLLSDVEGTSSSSSSAGSSSSHHLPQHPRRMDTATSAARARVASASTSHHLNECDEEVKLSIDVPGVRAKDLVVEVDDGVLRISGHRRIGVGSGMGFERSFRMDQTTIDTSRVTANLSAGVLVVTVPKRDKQERQVISVTEEPHDYEDENDTNPESIDS